MGDFGYSDPKSVSDIFKYTSGSILYIDANGVFQQDNSNLFFDAATKALLVGGQLQFKSGTGFKGIFAHANNQDRTYTFPNATGTVVLTGAALGQIVDADIAASGITTRSKLPSPLAYEDEANTFSFDQTFSGKIKFANFDFYQQGNFGPYTTPALVIAKKTSGNLRTDAIISPGAGNSVAVLTLVNAEVGSTANYIDASFSIDLTGASIGLSQQGTGTKIPFNIGVYGVNIITLNTDNTMNFNSRDVYSTGKVGINASSSDITTYDSPNLMVKASTNALLHLVGTVTGSDGAIGIIRGYNTASASADKRLGQIEFSRFGADNTGRIRFYAVNAGTLTNVMNIAPTSIDLLSVAVSNLTLGSEMSANTNDITGVRKLALGSGSISDSVGLQIYSGSPDYKIAFDNQGGGTGWITYNVDLAASTHAHVFSFGDISAGTYSKVFAVRGDGHIGLNAGGKFFLDINASTAAFGNTSIRERTADVVTIEIGGNDAFELSAPADTETALLVRRNVGGAFSLQRVSMGAVDSGGAGYKLLRVPN